MNSLLRIYILFSLCLCATMLPAQDVVPGQLVIHLEEKVQSAKWQDSFEEFRSLENENTFAERQILKSGAITRKAGAENQMLLFEFEESESDRYSLKDVLMNLDGVKMVEDVFYLQERSTPPNDPFYPEQWSLEIIELEEVWSVTSGGITINGDTIVVAIIDSGFKINHPELQDNIWINQAEAQGETGVDDDNNGYVDDINGWNFVADLPVHPEGSHGTAVAGIIGASGNNNSGMSGINWNVKMMVLTVLTTFDIAEAYTYALDLREKYNNSNGTEGAYVAVTNASLGLNSRWCEEFPSWGEIYDPLGEAGILNIAATANSNVDVAVDGDMPTSCPSEYLLTVTNTDRNDEKVISAGYSNIYIDMAAPGGPGNDGAFTLNEFDDYDESFGGTSASAPHATGVAALLYSMPCTELFEGSPAETVLLMKDAMMQGGDPLTALDGITVSGNRLNATRSMAWLHAYCQPYKTENPFEDYSSGKGFLRIGPNPLFSGEVLDVLYSADSFGPIDFTVYDILGRELYRVQKELMPFDEQAFSIPTLNLAAGTYILVIENGKDPISYKFVVL
ncbi:MAG: S8 family serine peptidase [Bacteroidetes bacterium]|nr:S8 family serine peptidase [Bacteroidota bacterium]